MFEFGPSGMTLVSQWLVSNGIPLVAGIFVGAGITFAGVAIKLIRLRREGIFC